MRELVKTVTAKGNKRIVCYINRVNNSYYEVVYRKKSEYLTNDLDVAILVAKIIIVYYYNMETCNRLLFQANTSTEKRWSNVIEFLRKEYNKSPVDSRIAINLFYALDDSFKDLETTKSKDDYKTISVAATIRAKDNLMKTIYDVASQIEPNIAYKNYNRYIKIRNPYVESNPGLNLEILRINKEDDKRGINTRQFTGKTA